MKVGDPAATVLVPENGHVQWACDWSADGRSVVYIDRDPDTWQDLWRFPLDGDRRPVPLVRTRFKEVDAQFSPDGRWIAYASDESGRYEVYIQPFPGSGEKRRISDSGGRTPRWRGDGREIYYVDLAAEPGLISVPLDPANPDLMVAPRPLFRVSSHVRHYDVTSDGQRFLINYEAEAGTGSVAHVVVNWTAGIKP
jgi:dipeptidyl aminopeptidase/acylaminoacyl peptidase